MASENATDKQQEPIFLSITNKTMTKFNELLEQAKAKKVLSFSEKFELQKAFNDLEDGEKTDEVKSEVDQEIAKPETEPKKEEPKSTEDPVQASETVTVEKYNEAMTRLAELETETRKVAVEKEFNESFAFSDSNKKGFLNAVKDKDNFINFAMTLNKTQKAMFYEILGNVDKNISAKFSEMGANSNQQTVVDNGQKYHEMVQKVVAEKNVDYDTAVDIVNAQLSA